MSLLPLKSCRDLLFRAYDLPLDILVVVRSSTCGAQTIHVVFYVVVAELADLAMRSVNTQRPVKRPSETSQTSDNVSSGCEAFRT